MTRSPSTWNGLPWPPGTVEERTAKLEAPPPDCFAAFASLAREDSPAVEAALVLHLVASDWRIRRAACEALGGAPRSAAALDLLVRRLSDDSAYVAATACRALAARRAPLEARALALLLDRPEPALRVAAIEALDACCGAASFAVLVRALETDPRQEVRRRAAFALFSHASADTWRALFDRWCEDALPRHRVWACELAARFGDAPDVARLEALESDRDGHVRRAARSARTPRV